MDSRLAINELMLWYSSEIKRREHILYHKIRQVIMACFRFCLIDRIINEICESVQYQKRGWKSTAKHLRLLLAGNHISIIQYGLFHLPVRWILKNSEGQRGSIGNLGESEIVVYDEINQGVILLSVEVKSIMWDTPYPFAVPI